MRSINRVQLLGNLGADPEIKTMQSGDRVATLRVATTDRWKDKTTGELKERTEWHRVVIYNQALVRVCEQYLTRGARLQVLDGRLETRSWDQDGGKRYTTEVVLRPYSGELILLEQRGEAGRGFASPPQQEAPPPPSAADCFQGVNGSHLSELEDEIPF